MSVLAPSIAARKLLARVWSFLERNYWRNEYLQYRIKYDLAKDFRFNGTNILFYGGGQIIGGARTYISHHSVVQSGEGARVLIGSDCAIANHVAIYTVSYFADQDMRRPERQRVTKDVVIGNGVWIGAGVFINPGATIGDNAVIGANSVVTRDVPPDSIMGGVPARPIRRKRY